MAHCSRLVVFGLSVSLSLLGGFMSDPLLAVDLPLPGRDPAPTATGGSGVIEGTVVEVESHTLVVKKNDGETVRVPMPGKSGEPAGQFSKGDYIEASVTPEGTTTSVRIVANPKKFDLNENIR